MRLRELLSHVEYDPFRGPADIHECCVGYSRRNMRNAQRKQLSVRRPPGNVVVFAAKVPETERVAARVVHSPDKPTLPEFGKDNVAAGAVVDTGENPTFMGLPHPHGPVKRSGSQ